MNWAVFLVLMVADVREVGLVKGRRWKSTSCASSPDELDTHKVVHETAGEIGH